jgi:hypothetical protein
MAELLVRVTDKTHPTENNRVSKRGDVIAVQPDGWAWGALELSQPFWRIVKLPNVTVQAASDALLAPGVRTGPQEPLTAVPLKAFRLDLAAVSSRNQAAAAFVTDDTRAQPSISIPWNLTQLTSSRVATR